MWVSDAPCTTPQQARDTTTRNMNTRSRQQQQQCYGQQTSKIGAECAQSSRPAQTSQGLGSQRVGNMSICTCVSLAAVCTCQNCKNVTFEAVYLCANTLLCECNLRARVKHHACMCVNCISEQKTLCEVWVCEAPLAPHNNTNTNEWCACQPPITCRGHTAWAASQPPICVCVLCHRVRQCCCCCCHVNFHIHHTRQPKDSNLKKECTLQNKKPDSSCSCTLLCA